MPVLFISSNESDVRLLPVNQQDKRFHFLALCVPFTEVTHFDTPGSPNQASENTGVAALYNSQLATIILNISNSNLDSYLSATRTPNITKFSKYFLPANPAKNGISLEKNSDYSKFGTA
jgi:hypothetical protein